MYKIELKGVRELTDYLSSAQSGILRVAAMALNKAATHARAQMVKMGRADYTMPATKLRGTIAIKKANARRLQAEVSVSGKTIPLVEFKTKGTGRPRGTSTSPAKTKIKKGRARIPVQAMVQKRGGFKLLSKAFRAQGRYGVGLFVRKSKKRGPLKMLSGPSVAGIVRTSSNFSKIIQSTDATLQREFQQGIEHALNKGRIASET